MEINGEWVRKNRKRLRMTQPELAKKIGVSVNTILNYEKGSTIPDSKIPILLRELGDNVDNESVEIIDPDRPSKKVWLIPFYDVEAMAGDDYSAENSPTKYPQDMIDVGDMLRDSKSAMRVYGSSMMPNYPPGCIVGLSEVQDNIISYGNVYVIETTDNRYIKRVYSAENAIECYSDNTSKFTEGPRTGKYYYETFQIPLESIKRIHRVVGVIKRNQNGQLIK